MSDLDDNAALLARITKERADDIEWIARAIIERMRGRTCLETLVAPAIALGHVEALVTTGEALDLGQAKEIVDMSIKVGRALAALAVARMSS